MILYRNNEVFLVYVKKSHFVLKSHYFDPHNLKKKWHYLHVFGKNCIIIVRYFSLYIKKLTFCVKITLLWSTKFEKKVTICAKITLLWSTKVEQTAWFACFWLILYCNNEVFLVLRKNCHILDYNLTTMIHKIWTKWHYLNALKTWPHESYT